MECEGFCGGGVAGRQRVTELQPLAEALSSLWE